MTHEEASRLNAIRASAESKLDELQASLNRMDAMVNESVRESSRNINTWQTWLGAIAFSLAAISGVVLVAQTTNYWALFATLVFLGTGVSIAISTKKKFEKEHVNGMPGLESTRPLIEEQKKIAWQIYDDPTRYEEVNPILQEAKRKEVRHLIKELEVEIIAARKSKISYSSDIWISLFSTGIYLLLINTGINAYNEAGLANEYIGLIIFLPWLLLLLFILNDALKERQFIKEANIRRISALEDRMESYKEYLKAIR